VVHVVAGEEGGWLNGREKMFLKVSDPRIVPTFRSTTSPPLCCCCCCCWLKPSNGTFDGVNGSTLLEEETGKMAPGALLALGTSW